MAQVDIIIYTYGSGIFNIEGEEYRYRPTAGNPIKKHITTSTTAIQKSSGRKLNGYLYVWYDPSDKRKPLVFSSIKSMKDYKRKHGNNLRDKFERVLFSSRDPRATEY